MPPYGKALGVMTDTDILDKCLLWTSEWLTRPHVAMSEFSSSVYENLPTIKLYENKVFTRQAVSYLLDTIKPLGHSLQRFNSKDTTLAEEPDTQDLCNLMTTVNNPDFVLMTKELFAAGGALYHMAAQLMVLQTLSKHPKDWAAKHRETPEVAPFKANPTPEGLRQYLETLLLRQPPPSATSSSGADVWSTTESPSVTQQATTALVWDNLDDPQQSRVRRPQSIWHEDDQTASTSAHGEVQDEYENEIEDEEEEEEHSVRPPKRRAQSNPFRGSCQESINDEEWEFSETSSDERDLSMAQEQVDPLPRQRISSSRTLPATITVSPRKKAPPSASTPTKRPQPKTPPRPSKRGKTPLCGSARRGKPRHIYFEDE